MRGPDGRFLAYGAELAAWLPRMLQRTYGDQIAEALRVIVNYLITVEQNHLRLASEGLVKFTSIQESESLSDYWLGQARKTRQRRHILTETIKKLQEVTNA